MIFYENEEILEDNKLSIIIFGYDENFFVSDISSFSISTPVEHYSLTKLDGGQIKLILCVFLYSQLIRLRV